MMERSIHRIATEIRDLYAKQCAYADQLRAVQNTANQKVIELCRARNHKHMPELNHFPNVFEQQDALRRALSDKLLRGRTRLTQIAVWVAVFAGCLTIQLYSAALWPTFAVVVVLGGTLIVYHHYAPWHRAAICRHLRRQLVERGVPICIECGYDLRGQTTPRCPECGTAADAAILAQGKETAHAV